MMDWEGRFNALVRRLVEIADAKDDDAMDDWTRVGCYDLIAHAHEKDLQRSKEAMLAAEGAG